MWGLKNLLAKQPTMMQRINGAAKIVETCKGQVNLDAVLNIKAFSLQKVLDMEPDFMKVSVTMGLCMSSDWQMQHSFEQSCTWAAKVGLVTMCQHCKQIVCYLHLLGSLTYVCSTCALYHVWTTLMQPARTACETQPYTHITAHRSIPHSIPMRMQSLSLGWYPHGRRKVRNTCMMSL